MKRGGDCLLYPNITYLDSGLRRRGDLVLFASGLFVIRFHYRIQFHDQVKLLDFCLIRMNIHICCFYVTQKSGVQSKRWRRYCKLIPLYQMPRNTCYLQLITLLSPDMVLCKFVLFASSKSPSSLCQSTDDN